MREKGDREERTRGVKQNTIYKGVRKKNVEKCDGNYSQVCTRGKLYT